MHSLLFGLAPAQADVDPVTALGGQLNMLWVVIGAVLVIFMQAGFALVETGFCRAKHAAHVVSTNFAVFGLGFIGFFLIGWPLSLSAMDMSGYFGGLGSPVGSPLIDFGDNWIFLFKGGWGLSGGGIDAGVLAIFLYMVAFMDTTATIPTGAMAERWKWGSFVMWGFFCGAIYYPLFAAWTWGGGWLAKTWDTMDLGAGYVDFAGSGVVHAMGGAAALAGALVLGPRIGKFGRDGKPRTLAGHHIPMAILGTFILLFGWFGFNAASTFAATDVQFATVATNTALAAAFGAIVAMFWITRRKGKPDPGMMANGMLAGLVAITAPCAFVTPSMAALIGAIAGVLVIEAIFFVEGRLKVDDPVGAISVHGVCGIFGVLVRRAVRQRQLRRGVERLRRRWRRGTVLRRRARTTRRPGRRGTGDLHRHVRGRLHVLQGPEQGLHCDGQGRHPLQGGGRDHRPRRARRWACSPTPSSRRRSTSSRKSSNRPCPATATSARSRCPSADPLPTLPTAASDSVSACAPSAVMHADTERSYVAARRPPTTTGSRGR